MKIGLDIGSTTLKCVVLDYAGRIVFQSYERHYSQITENTALLLEKIQTMFPDERQIQLAVSGSAGLGIATDLGVQFVQEVYATQVAVKKLAPKTDVVIELGGEDAKILFLTDVLEVRMNGSCAGGTGAFIDQIATLLNIPTADMNELAKSYHKIYTIASRCGVFAKSDIQPLVNQGAIKNDICASIFYAVVNQTIGGLAQGREIKGNIMYLGGSLTFFSELRRAFDKTLGTEGLCPENSLYFVALGAAYCISEPALALDALVERVRHYIPTTPYANANPLFLGEEDYLEFKERHDKDTVPCLSPETFEGNAYLGIDAGSTTVKMAVIDEDEQIIFSCYRPNSGNPIPIIKDFLWELYEKYPHIKLKSSAATGYGEDIIRNAFRIDYGIVETIAHLTGAKKFMSDVDFIIDIGGQDIKCLKIVDGMVDNIFLNEACSSGCGSFLQTFAGALNYDIADFVKLGLYADAPVDLGSRCTVFMNSSVKQAQKDGASLENISAGLSISVVKNALYKVIRAVSADTLGKRIVVQGGTFLNDAVLRAFELEIGRNVVRPAIAGLMGAFGSALYAKNHQKDHSDILDKEQLLTFTHDVHAVHCKLCTNRCLLTVNTFDDGRKFIGGNRCDRPIAGGKRLTELNIYEYKRQRLERYRPIPGTRGKIGLPMGLNFYELLPFWHSFFTVLGFEVVTSGASNRKLYLSGQNTIPSDTVCFPAKLMHGHVEALLKEGIDTIFYPCMSYNIDEKLGDNHYNCPVVAYYPEVIAANMGKLDDIRFIYDYVGIHRPKEFPEKIHTVLNKYFVGITKAEVQKACTAAYEEYAAYLSDIRTKGAEYIKEAEALGMPIIVLAGRPYHIDGEINHGIDKLICSFGAAVISEDSLTLTEKKSVHVLNQWTYHSRLYAAADFVGKHTNMNLIQLVSFGCGVDAITTDEMRSILEQYNKIYTQIKIDEITNLGAVTIRLRSLFAALE